MILILAAGGQTRWNAKEVETKMILPKIKQLVLIDGQPLILKIQQQFTNSIVVTKTPEIKKQSLRWFEPDNNEVTLATLFSTRDLWDEWITILLGDVLYGEDTIAKIKLQDEQIMFYGDKGEIYAFKFHLATSVEVISAIHKIVSSKDFLPKYGKLWNLYRQIRGRDFRIRDIGSLFTYVRDCQDFDNKEQYVRYAKKKRVRR